MERERITWQQFSMYAAETVAMTPADSLIALQSLASQKLHNQQKAL
jgi:hypothetical protein